MRTKTQSKDPYRSTKSGVKYRTDGTLRNYSPNRRRSKQGIDLAVLHLPLHHRPQRCIDPGLIPAPSLLEPRNHVSIQTQSDRLLQRTVQVSDLQIGHLGVTRRCRKIQRSELHRLPAQSRPFPTRTTGLLIYLSARITSLLHECPSFWAT